MAHNPFFDSTQTISPFKVVQYDTLYDFPTVGVEGSLYIDKSENRAYRWDTDSLLYFCVGSDWKDIEVINGGVTDGE